jgi:hypothetical protein
MAGASLMAFMLVAAPQASAQVLYEGWSELQAWEASSGFSKAFGAEMRWGRNFNPNADWELGLLEGTDPSPVEQREFIWGDKEHAFNFAAGSGGSASLTVGGTSFSHDFSATTGSLNTLVIQARAGADRVGVLDDFRIALNGGGTLGPASRTIVGGDLAFYVFQDARLGDGFEVRSNSDGGVKLDVLAGSGSGSDPAFNFKVGTSRVPVPEPGTALLLGTGVLGLIAQRRRRDDTVV